MIRALAILRAAPAGEWAALAAFAAALALLLFLPEIV